MCHWAKHIRWSGVFPNNHFSNSPAATVYPTVEFHSVLILSTWNYHQIPQVKGLSPMRLPAVQLPVIKSWTTHTSD